MHLQRSRTRPIKNTDVVCRTPETLYGVLSNLFLIHSFYTLLLTMFEDFNAFVNLPKPFFYMSIVIEFFVKIQPICF